MRAARRVVDRDWSAAGTRAWSRSRRGPAWRRASRTDSGTGSQPARRPSCTTGGASGEVAERAGGGQASRAVLEQHDGVGVLHHPFEPVLGHHDRDAEVVDEARDGRQHLLGRRRVERRGRFVEHQDPRVGGEHRSDRHALLLSAGERAQRAPAQLGDAQQVEGLLHPLPHDGLGHRELLHGVGQLLLHRVHHEAGQRVLPDHAHDVGEVARRVVARVSTVDDDAAGQVSAGEVRARAR